jgi:hypothetical protein
MQPRKDLNIRHHLIGPAHIFQLMQMLLLCSHNNHKEINNMFQQHIFRNAKTAYVLVVRSYEEGA